jgi:hypothetical protein
MTIGIVVVASLAARVTGGGCGHDHIHLGLDELGEDLGQPIEPPLGRPALDRNVLPFHVP